MLPRKNRTARHWIIWGFSLAFVCAIGIGGKLAAGSQAAEAATSSHRATLTAFRSEEELEHYLKHLARVQPPPPPPDAVSSAVAGNQAEAMATVTGSTVPAAPGITNVQEAGVDEGDIVKLRGDILVILRRGRLFTVSLAAGRMHPVDSVNAYPPGVDARADWYDEMLITEDRIVVIGYSYGRGGTEINRFRIDDGGHLKFEDAYQLRSKDYYSARNYASRLIGHQLIFYSPLYLPYAEADMLLALPALRRWTGDPSAPFERIGSAREVYMSPFVPEAQIRAVHTVTSCDLAAAVIACKAISVLGPAGRVFYVSPHAVYVWVTSWWGWEADTDQGKRPSSILYRLPLDGGAPSAVGVRGAPEDQFSFRENASDGMLNVLVHSEGGGDAMWASEFSQGAVALLRLPLDRFGDGTQEAALAEYQPLPRPRGNGPLHNRFAGDYLLYGTGNGWGAPEGGDSILTAVPVHGGAPTQLVLPHGVDRIEVMGRDAVVVGSDERNVYFSTVELASGAQPKLGDRYMREGASQAETRSHGFFYKPESAEGDAGILGLPIARPAREAYRHLFEESAAMIFLRRAGGHFAPLGEIDSHPETAADDACVASCVDWYGNARPIFVGERSFALMGYELVEGRLLPDSIREIGRISFAPRTPHLSERPAPSQ